MGWSSVVQGGTGGHSAPDQEPDEILPHLWYITDIRFTTDCWAAGAASGGCGHLEKALRECMDAPVRPSTNSLNAAFNRISGRVWTDR